MSELAQGASHRDTDSQAPSNQEIKFDASRFLRDSINAPSLDFSQTTRESQSQQPYLPQLQIDMGSARNSPFGRKNPWSIDADPASSKSPFTSAKHESENLTAEVPSWIREGIKKNENKSAETPDAKIAADTRNAEKKKLDSGSSDARQADSKSSETKPADPKPADIKQADAKSSDAKQKHPSPLLPYLEIRNDDKKTEQNQTIPFLDIRTDSKQQDKLPGFNIPQDKKLNVTRSIEDLKVFYKAQDDGVSCSAFSIAMLYSDQFSGRPVDYGKQAQSFKQLAGTIGRGYRGDLQSMADKVETLGLNAKAYSYKKVDEQTLKDLDKELAMGHSAIGHVKNPHTGNGHYIFIAGKTSDGKYIIGDPDKANSSHFKPVTPKVLLSMMGPKDGFVAGWSKDNYIPAANVKGTAAYRRLHGS